VTVTTSAVVPWIHTSLHWPSASVTWKLWGAEVPETDTSMWYFWGMARNFRAKDKALTASIRDGQGKIFAEDLQMLEAQQRNLLAWPDRNLLKLNIDAGGVQSRRVIDRLVAQEQAGTTI